MTFIKASEINTSTDDQDKIDRRPRSERRKEILELRRKKKKLERRLKDVLLEIELNNESTTAFGNFHFIESFKQSIDLNGIINDEFTLTKGPNSIYSAVDTLDFLLDSCILGHSRFEHTEALRFDPGYQDIKGIERYPSEKVFRDLFSFFTFEHIKELCSINRRLIELRSQWEGPQEVWFDIDSTTITLFGEQQGGEIRYNSRYRGRPSYELMVCFINKTRDLLYIDICPEGQTPKALFKDFLSKCNALLPSNYVLKGLRIDKGFFSENNIYYLESQFLAYVAKVPMYPNIRHYIENLPQEEWKEVDEYMSVTRKKLLLDSWEHDRYIDIRRLKIEKKTGQMVLPEAQYYRYEAVLSSELEQSAEANLSWYDDRATAEDLIKEVKDGFAVEEASQHRLIKNTAYAFVKVISYNLFQFFKAVAMPGSHQSWQIHTLRRKLINLPGNILGVTRNRRAKLASRAYLKLLLPQIQRKLRQFLWFVANDFRRCDLSLVYIQ
jgi:hypothetical protein